MKIPIYGSKLENNYLELPGLLLSQPFVASLLWGEGGDDRINHGDIIETAANFEGGSELPANVGLEDSSPLPLPDVVILDDDDDYMETTQPNHLEEIAQQMQALQIEANVPSTPRDETWETPTEPQPMLHRMVGHVVIESDDEECVDDKETHHTTKVGNKFLRLS